MRHVLNFQANHEEARRLVEIHEELTGTKPGYRHRVQILNKAAIVLLVASWEVNVEDLAAGALSFMIARARRHDVFPDFVLESVANKHHGLDAWKLAGGGWRDVLKDNLKEVLGRTTEKFNSPITDRINALFEKTIGLKSLSSAWHWKGVSRLFAETRLDKLVELRGQIAHRIKTDRTVYKSEVEQAADFLVEISTRSSNYVRDYVFSRTKRYPWPLVGTVRMPPEERSPARRRLP